MIQRAVLKCNVRFARLGSLAVIFILSIAISFRLAFSGAIYPSVMIAGQPVAGWSKREVTDWLIGQTEREDLRYIRIRYRQQEVVIPLNAVGGRWLVAETVDQAYQIGRDHGWPRQLLSPLLFFRQNHIPVAFEWSHQDWENALATVSADVTIPAIPPSINLTVVNGKKEVAANAGRSGQEIDWTILNQNLSAALGAFRPPVFDLPITTEPIAVTVPELNQARDRAIKLIGKSIRLTHQEKEWLVSDADLISWIGFQQEYDQSKIASFSAALSSSVDRSPQNALFTFENQRVTAFQPAVSGKKLKQNELSQQIVDHLRQLEKDSVSTADLSLPMDILPAAIQTADSNSFGISGSIGKGESWYYHSIASRIHNVELASAKFHGVLVPPGETLSFNQTVGDISLQSGYQQAYIIKEGRTILGDGGGVCQVSTTLFRAALRAGLEIVERSAHAYRVSYYEQNSPVGLDATVFTPKPDLVIRNNTTHHILVQRIIDPRNYYLAFELFGHPDNRQVSLSPTRLWDQSPPPPDLFQDDPTLPAGQVKQIDWPAWGAKAAFDYKVVLEGKILQEKTFYSTYRPWQAVFLRGTKP